jgi:hypothetical protein
VESRDRQQAIARTCAAEIDRDRVREQARASSPHGQAKDDEEAVTPPDRPSILDGSK